MSWERWQNYCLIGEAVKDHEARDLLEESRKAIEILNRLVTKLEIYTDQVEHELDRRAEVGGE